MSLPSNVLNFVSFQDLRILKDIIGKMSKSSIREKRLELFRYINGDSFYPLKKWPKKYIRMFWDKPLTDRSTFELVLFMVCNGCPPYLVTVWIMYSQYWNTKALNKRFCQLQYILNNFDKYRNKWFYFDIEGSVHRYISGTLRKSNSTCCHVSPTVSRNDHNLSHG